MKRALLAALLLAGCATGSAPPGTQVAAERLQQGVIPGTTTRTQLLAAFGPTKRVVFDSGYEAWVYRSPAKDGRVTEFVILVNPAGLVAKARSRTAPPPE